MRPNKPSCILLIVANCGPGDALSVDYCLRAIRDAYPNAELHLLADAAAYPVFEQSQLFGRIFVSRLHERPGTSLLQARLRKLGQIVWTACRMRRRYDFVVTFLEGSTLLNVLARIVGRKSIGYANALPILLSTRIGRFDYYGNTSEQHGVLLRAIGIESVVPRPASPIHSRQDDAAVQQMLKTDGLDRSSCLVVLHPGADWACQQWLASRWAELADQLHTDYGADLLFTGVASECPYIEAIRSKMRSHSISLAGKTTLPQLTSLLTRTDLCICVDSAVYELTQSIGAQAIVLAGPSPVERTVPGNALPIIINKIGSELKNTITRCRSAHDMYNGCLDYGCSMAGLRDIEVEAVLAEVRDRGLLKLVPNVPARFGDTRWDH